MSFCINFPKKETEYKAYSDQLQVGDIVLEKVRCSKLISSHYLDIAIVIGQWIAQKFYQLLGRNVGLTFEDAKTIHVYQIVEITDSGDVLLADAMPSKHSKLRIISLWKDRGIADDYIHSSCGYKMEIIRLKDQTIAQNSAQKSASFSVKASYLQDSPNPSKQAHFQSEFSFKLGRSALFTNYVNKPYSLSEKKRMMKLYLDHDLTTSLSTGGSHPRKFFCSYFISQQLLGAHVSIAFAKMYKKLTASEQLSIHTSCESLRANVTNLNYKNSSKLVSGLAKELAQTYGDRMIEELKKLESLPQLRLAKEPDSEGRILDPKYTSPQMFARMLRDERVGSLVGRVLPSK